MARALLRRRSLLSPATLALRVPGVGVAACVQQRLALFVLAGVLAGCGDGPGAPAASTTPTAFTRLQPGLAAGASAVPETALVSAFDLLDGSADWVVETPERAVAHLPSGARDEASRVLQLKAGRTDELVRVTRHGAFDPAAFNELRVPIQIAGHGAVRIEFHRDGKTVAQSDATLLHSGTGLVPITVPIPLEVRAAGPFDGVALRLDGDARTYSVRRFELRRAPPAALLPDPARGAELVFVDGEARRGIGVCAGRDAVTTASVPAGGWLSWSCAQPPAVRRPGTRVTLEVSVAPRDGGDGGRGGHSTGDNAGGNGDADRGAALVQRVEFEAADDQPSRWHAERLQLASLAGREVVITFRCSAGDGGEAGCVLAEAALCRPDERGTAARRPDVLLITSDTHRGDHLGAARSGVVLDTPTLDALAARGVLFTDAFSPANVTNPSHMALMTGTSPRDIGILENVTALADAAPTLAEAFRDAGYATWSVLSTEHLGPRGSGLGQGFDRASWPPHVPRRSGESVGVVERWLPERDGRPLFLWLHVFDAHWKYEPPPGFDRRYYPRGKDPDDPSLPPLPLADGVLPPDMAGLRDLEFPRAQYRAEISSEDHELARLLERPPFADALTVFVGDHGECLGEHGIWFNHDGLYPDTLHIPLILALPRGAAAMGASVVGGTRVSVPVTHLDVGRTLLDLAGLRDAPFPGRDLPLHDAGAPGQGATSSGAAGQGATAPGATEPGATAPGAAGPAAADAPPRFALAAGALCASVTWRGQHLILTLAGYRTPRMERAVEKHRVELYDLRADPGCEHDLLDSQPALARTLRARLIEWLAGAPALGWASSAAHATDDEGLAALGYTGAAATPPAHALWADDDCAWCRRMR